MRIGDILGKKHSKLFSRLAYTIKKRRENYFLALAEKYFQLARQNGDICRKVGHIPKKGTEEYLQWRANLDEMLGIEETYEKATGKDFYGFGEDFKAQRIMQSPKTLEARVANNPEIKGNSSYSNNANQRSYFFDSISKIKKSVNGLAKKLSLRKTTKSPTIDVAFLALELTELETQKSQPQLVSEIYKAIKSGNYRGDLIWVLEKIEKYSDQFIATTRKYDSTNEGSRYSLLRKQLLTLEKYIRNTIRKTIPEYKKAFDPVAYARDKKQLKKTKEVFSEIQNLYDNIPESEQIPEAVPV